LTKVGPYALREKLNPKQCIWVTSGGAYTKSLDVQMTFHPAPGKSFDGVAAYANCKRAQISLARLLNDDVMHPGWAESPGLRKSLPNVYAWTKDYLRTSEEGIDTILWLVFNRPSERNFWFDRAPAVEHKWYARTKATAEEEAKLLDEVRKAASKVKL
jgi:dehydrogenase/reductase SDR family protein 12